jgi:hypothetical protein
MAKLLLQYLSSDPNTYAKGYQDLMNQVFQLDRMLNQNHGVPMPKYPYRTVQDGMSLCQQVNDFIAECDNSLWASTECRGLLEAINGCANRELILTDGESSTCRPTDPGGAEAAAILEAECSQLQRGADGQNPCDRRPPEGSNPGQWVVERCKPREDELTTGEGGGAGTGGGSTDPTKKDCPTADLQKFLDMVVPAKDMTYLYEKLKLPRPPVGGTGETGPPGPTGPTGPR